MRRNLATVKGDVWITGYPSAGNLRLQMIVRTLLNDGDAEKTWAAPYACGITAALEQDVSRSKVTLDYVDSLPPCSRVFTTHHMPENLPCRGAPSSRTVIDRRPNSTMGP